MKVYYCPVPLEEFQAGNNGLSYLADHTDKWIDGTELLTYLSTGWVKGCDYIIHEGKCYMIYGSYQNLEKGYVVHACIEDNQVRRNSITENQFNNLQSM